MVASIGWIKLLCVCLHPNWISILGPRATLGLKWEGKQHELVTTCMYFEVCHNELVVSDTR